MKTSLALLTCSLILGTAEASGTLQLQGKLLTLTRTNLAIETEKNVYTVDRQKLSSQALEAIQASGHASGKTVAITVPMDAIQSVKPRATRPEASGP